MGAVDDRDGVGYLWTDDQTRAAVELQPRTASVRLHGGLDDTLVGELEPDQDAVAEADLLAGEVVGRTVNEHGVDAGGVRGQSGSLGGVTFVGDLPAQG